MPQKSDSMAGLIGGLLVAGAAYGVTKGFTRSATDELALKKPRFRNSKQTRRLAAHEAAHALVAWKLGNEVRGASIGDRDGDGQADHGVVANVSSDSNPWRRLALYMAGVVGEGFVVGQYQPVYAQTDLREAAKAAHQVLQEPQKIPWRRPGGRTVKLNCMSVSGLPDEHRVVMEEAASYAKLLIRRNRKLFDLIREELAKKGEITEDEFAELTSEFE